MKDKMKVFALNVLLFIMKHIRVILPLAYLATQYFSGKNSDALMNDIAECGEMFGDSFTTDSNTSKKKGEKRQ